MGALNLQTTGAWRGSELPARGLGGSLPGGAWQLRRSLPSARCGLRRGTLSSGAAAGSWRLRGHRRRQPGPSAAAQLPDQPEESLESLRAFRKVPLPKRTAKLEPSFHLSRENAVELQLKALQNNNFPTNDAGIEVLYRFAGFDPFARSRYFGCSLDLGQFERFRRIFYTPCFSALLNHTSHTVLSQLEVSEDVWRTRVLVCKEYYLSKEEHVYEFTMKQRLGGRYDGIWFTESLICDGCDDRTLFGVI